MRYLSMTLCAFVWEIRCFKHVFYFSQNKIKKRLVRISLQDNNHFFASGTGIPDAKPPSWYSAGPARFFCFCCTEIYAYFPAGSIIFIW